MAYIRAAFHWQEGRDDNFTSPIIRGMSRTSTKERQRKRILSDDELRAVWKATTEHGTFGALIRFLLLTAARRDEARMMTWQEIKGTDWFLPARRNWKTKLELVRPLSKAARDVLNTLPRKSAYVFAGRNGAIANRGGLGTVNQGGRREKPRALTSSSPAPAYRPAPVSLRIMPSFAWSRPARHSSDLRYPPVRGQKRAAFEKLAALVRKIVGQR